MMTYSLLYQFYIIFSFQTYFVSILTNTNFFSLYLYFTLIFIDIYQRKTLQKEKVKL